MDLCSCKIGSPCADVAGKVDQVAAYSKAGSVGFWLLRAVGADEASIGWLVVWRDIIFVDDEDSVCSLDAVANALGKASKFVGTGKLRVVFYGRILVTY